MRKFRTGAESEFENVTPATSGAGRVSRRI